MDGTTNWCIFVGVGSFWPNFWSVKSLGLFMTHIFHIVKP
jgi:hypothetical protein